MDLLRDSVGRLYLKFLLPSLFRPWSPPSTASWTPSPSGRAWERTARPPCAIIYPILGVASLFGFLCGIGGSVRFGKSRGEGRKKRPTPTTRPRWFWCSFSRRSYGPAHRPLQGAVFTLFGASESLMPLVLEYGGLDHLDISGLHPVRLLYLHGAL